MPEAEEVDVSIEPKDLKIDTYKSQGAGGQSVNTTDSAVRITHLPTGLKVEMQDERSQHQNKVKAMRIIRSRVFDHIRRKEQEERNAERGSLLGSGNRSDRIRTFNFPQSRITDHRIGLSVNNLEAFLNGDEMAVNTFVDALHLAEVNEQIEALNEEAKLAEK